MKLYSKILDAIQAIFKWVIIFAMAAFTIIIIVSVFYRYVLTDPITWAEQAARFLFVWVIMLGIPVYYRMRLATNFDLVVEKIPPVPRKIIAIIMDVMVGLFAVYYGYSGLSYTITAGRSIFQGLGLPSGCIYISEVVCSAYLLLCVIETVINQVEALVYGKSELKGGKA